MRKKLFSISLVFIMCILSSVHPIQAQSLKVKFKSTPTLIVKNYGEYISMSIPVETNLSIGEEWYASLSFNAPLEKMKDLLNENLLNDIKASKIPQMYLSNKAAYDFYLTQHNTGAYSDINCMAASAATITKWINPLTAWNVESVRNKVAPQGGVIYTDEISDFFDDVNIKYTTWPIYTSSLDRSYETILKALNRGSILMTCANMDKISYSYNSSHLGKSYLGGFKHSYLITGYVVFQDELFFEVFDPYDTVICTRFMRAKEVVQSILSHWGFVFEIPQQRTAFVAIS